MDSLVEMLMEKLVQPAPRGPHEAKQSDQVAVAIQAYVKNRVHKNLDFQMGVTSETIPRLVFCTFMQQLWPIL
jgi:hypothetical protein